MDLDALEKSDKMVKPKKKNPDGKPAVKKPRSKTGKIGKAKKTTPKKTAPKAVKKKNKVQPKSKAKAKSRVRAMKRPAASASAKPAKVAQDQEQGEEEEEEIDQVVEPSGVTRTRKPPIGEAPVSDDAPDVPQSPSQSVQTTKYPAAAGAPAPECPPQVDEVKPRAEIAQSQEPTESQPSTVWYHGFILLFS